MYSEGTLVAVTRLGYHHIVLMIGRVISDNGQTVVVRSDDDFRARSRNRTWLHATAITCDGSSAYAGSVDSTEAKLKENTDG